MGRLNLISSARRPFQWLFPVFIAWLGLSQAAAQSYTSPGYPWTYVPRSELPVGVLDTANENSLDTVSFLCPDTEIRRVFYVYVHPELVLGDSLGRFPVIVPRDPGEVDTITMKNLYSDAIQRSEYLFVAVGGLFSDDKPEYSTGDVELTCFYEMSGDTSCRGYIARLPATYIFVNNLDRDPWTRWLNIVQCVDSIWHPPLASSAPEVMVGEMEIFLAYPNPVVSGESIRLHPPKDWPRRPAELIITGQAGRVLYRRLVGTLHDGDSYSIPSELAAGVYTLVIQADGRRAATRIVVK
jgi:hypothetical protein